MTENNLLSVVLNIISNESELAEERFDLCETTPEKLVEKSKMDLCLDIVNQLKLRFELEEVSNEEWKE
jgi:hypothetical protein